MTDTAAQQAADDPESVESETAATEHTEPPTPFHDLDAYLALRRQGGIALSPDGSRLVAVAADLDTKKTGYTSAIWDVDPSGTRPARRLTRSAPGESSPAFLPDGSLLFVSKRPGASGTDAAEDKDAKPALWLLPAGGGEARLTAKRDGGVAGVLVARRSGTVAVAGAAFTGTDGAEADEKKRKARKDNKVAAILHEGYPVRFWDHDLGPEQPRLFLAAPGDDDEKPWEVTDLSGDVGRALMEAAVDISADGEFVAATWQRVDGHVESVADLVRIDIPTGQRTVLASGAWTSFYGPAISPDGTTIACVRHQHSTPDEPGVETLVLVPATGGDPREFPLPGELRPTELAWSPDGATLYFAADQDGRAPVFALDVASATTRRLVADAAYSGLAVHPDGTTLFAVRSSYTDPGSVVALATDGEDQQPRVLLGPATVPTLPGTLTEVRTTVADGTEIRAFLALPDGASAADPAPLLLWVHGGPVSSWNSWSWRWCPWLMVAQGYAVLLPDPALSTGYGQQMLRRGWGNWGDAPFTDLMAITDETLRRDDLDSTRTAAMGGSFGGYMANWIAGHTDRFRAIVTHASLWALDQFGATTDAPDFWRHEMTPEVAAANSPHASAADITTPMLVIHGDRDYRVPIGEGLRLWWDLLAGAKPDQDLPHRFLYFPDENHWVLSPQHAKIWYATVHAFLAWHVLGKDWERPELV